MHQYLFAVLNVSVGTTPKTVLNLATPSTRRAKLLELAIGFRSVTAADNPALVELLRQDGSGTGTALTLRAVNEGDPAALCSAKHTLTVEPTTSTLLQAWDVPVQGGQLIYQIPFTDLISMAVSSFLGLRVTTGQNEVCDVYGKVQE